VDGVGQRPFVSIVMTTRNRASRLPDAVGSVLDQDFGDFELVVSDNWSTDRTAEVLRGFDDPRVRAVRPPQMLAQPDGWEFALGHARGEYVAFLGDDDALCAGALARVAEVAGPARAPVVAWDPGFYYYDEWYEPERANTVELFGCSGAVREVASRETLSWLFTGRGMPLPGVNTPPLIITSAYRADVVERLRRRNGGFFLPIHCDIAACVAMLTQTDRYLHVNDGLSLRGKGEGNCSYELYRAPRGGSHVTELGDAARLRHVALDSVTLWNLTCETMLRMKALMPAELADLDVPPEHYLAKQDEDLQVLRRRGVDVSGELREVGRAVARLGPEERARLRQARGCAARWGPRATVRWAIDRWPALSRLEQLIRGPAGEWAWVRKKVVIRGRDAGFAGIRECARWLDGAVRAELHRVGLGRGERVPGRGKIAAGNPWKVL
jgi:Glycosyl transferase family 2